MSATKKLLYEAINYGKTDSFPVWDGEDGKHVGRIYYVDGDVLDWLDEKGEEEYSDHVVATTADIYEGQSFTDRNTISRPVEDIFRGRAPSFDTEKGRKKYLGFMSRGMGFLIPLVSVEPRRRK